MKARTRIGRGFALAIAVLMAPAFAAAQNLVLNPSFETAAHASWTESINPAGGATFPDSAATPPVTDGVNGIAGTQTLIDASYLYQDVVLPSSGLYRVSADVGCAGGAAATDFCRFDITNTAATSVGAKPNTDTLATADPDVLKAIFSRDGASAVAPQANHSAIFSGTAGQTVRIRFYMHASVAVTPYFIDNVKLGPVQQVPTLSQWTLVILGALLALFGLARMRRGNRAA